MRRTYLSALTAMLAMITAAVSVEMLTNTSIASAQTSNVRSHVDGDFWATGTGRFGSRAAFVSAGARLLVDALAGATTVIVDNTSVFRTGAFIEISDGEQTMHAADIISISLNSLQLNRPLPVRINAGAKVEQIAPVDPRGAIQLGRNIPARRHALVRMYRAGEEVARLGLDEYDNMALMAGGVDTPALVVEKSGYVRLASSSDKAPSGRDCNEPHEYFRIAVNHDSLFVCTKDGWKSSTLRRKAL